MRSYVPRTPRRPVDTLPSDRTPDRRPRKSGSPAPTQIEQDIARPKHLTPSQRDAKQAANVLNRKRLARLVYRRHGADPDALTPERVQQSEPIPATPGEIEAQAEFRDLADMLGLGGSTP